MTVGAFGSLAPWSVLQTKTGDRKFFKISEQETLFSALISLFDALSTSTIKIIQLLHIQLVPYQHH